MYNTVPDTVSDATIRYRQAYGTIRIRIILYGCLTKIAGLQIDVRLRNQCLQYSNLFRVEVQQRVFIAHITRIASAISFRKRKSPVQGSRTMKLLESSERHKTRIIGTFRITHQSHALQKTRYARIHTASDIF